MKKSEICKFFNFKHFVFPITLVETFIRTYGNHCFSNKFMMPRDVKESMSIVWTLLVLHTTSMHWPFPGSQLNSSREVLCSQKDDLCFQWFQSLYTPYYPSKDELGLCIDVLTFMLFKSRKTGLIILYFRKKIPLLQELWKQNALMIFKWPRNQDNYSCN